MPNARAEELPKGLLFKDSAEGDAHANCQRHLGYVFGWLRVQDAIDYATAFTDWHQPLTLSQANELQSDRVK